MDTAPADAPPAETPAVATAAPPEGQRRVHLTLEAHFDTPDGPLVHVEHVPRMAQLAVCRMVLTRLCSHWQIPPLVIEASLKLLVQESVDARAADTSQADLNVPPEELARLIQSMKLGGLAHA